MEDKQRTYYEILGVGMRAPSSEIEDAHKYKITQAKKAFKRDNVGYVKKEKEAKQEYAESKKVINQTLWDKMVEIALERKERKEARDRDILEYDESASTLLDRDSRRNYNRELRACAFGKTIQNTGVEGGTLVPTGKSKETELTVFEKCAVFIKYKPAVICIPVAGVVLAGAITYSSLKNKSDDELPKETISTVDETYEANEPTDISGLETENVSIFDMGITRFDRYHVAVEGDTLSKLSIHSNARQEDIKKINNMSSDTIVKGEEYIIPYRFDSKDLRYYLSIDEYDPSEMTLSEFALAHETTIDTLIMLNGEVIVQNGDGYEVITDSLTIPEFNAHEAVQEQKKSNQKIK